MSKTTKFTVIDSQRGIAPRPDTRLDPAVRAHLTQLQQKAPLAIAMSTVGAAHRCVTCSWLINS